MEVLTSNSQKPPVIRRGCNPALTTQRSKMQSKRVNINQQLTKQLRLRAGAENLYNATSNPKVKETVAVELSFVNSSLQMLKEELSSINASVDPYQSKNGKTVSIPMIPLGLKDTNEVNFTKCFVGIFSEHYGEDPALYTDEIADLCDLRNSIRTPARNEQGINLLLEYYNQLYYIEKRFYFPTKTEHTIYFHWYDSLTGIPALQKSISLEKASIIFNIGALYSQLACKDDRTRKKGIEKSVEHFQKAAGAFHFLRMNFSNPPTDDLSHHFLSAVTKLMLAQSQECIYELRVFGGFEIELGKCVHISKEAMKVSEKYNLALEGFNCEEVSSYVPYIWSNMCEVKALFYRALSHYYAAMGLLKQNEAAEFGEVSDLMNDLYVSKSSEDFLKSENLSKKKEDRMRLGRAHLREANRFHDLSIETHHLYKKEQKNDVLKGYLQHAKERTQLKLKDLGSKEDFFEFTVIPQIRALPDLDSGCIPPSFDDAPISDIFRRLGPLAVFSARNRLGAHRVIQLPDDVTNDLQLSGDSPVQITSVGERLKELGLIEDDVIIAVNNDDVRWKSQAYVRDLLHRNKPSSVRVVALLGAISVTSPTAGFATNQSTGNSLREGEVIQHNNNNNNSNNKKNLEQKTMPTRLKSSMKRYSLGFNFRDSFATLAPLQKKKEKNSQKRTSLFGSLRRSGSQILFGENKDSSKGHFF